MIADPSARPLSECPKQEPVMAPAAPRSEGLGFSPLRQMVEELKVAISAVNARLTALEARVERAEAARTDEPVKGPVEQSGKRE